MSARKGAFEDTLSALLHSTLADSQVCKERKLKLILHAGTPKTGTTSMQTYLAKKQRKLRGLGILYPHSSDELRNPSAPIHQWFEKNLVTTHTQHFLQNFTHLISQVKPHTHTVILSSEGIYNYWWDFPPASKRLLRSLANLFDVHIWVWFREPLGFIESFYKQCIRNPQTSGNPCYGKDLSFAEMLEINWFTQHLDYAGFVEDCQQLFGQDHVQTFAYRGDVVQQLSAMLGLATAHDNPTAVQNRSLHGVSIDLMRVLNQYSISAKDKDKLMPHIKQIDQLLSRYLSQSVVDNALHAKVLTYYKPVHPIL